MLKELPWDDGDAPDFNDDETISMMTKNFPNAAMRSGYSNQLFTEDKNSIAILHQMDQASSTKAIVAYNADTNSYVRLVSSGENDDYVKYFHKALAKAPRASKPYRVYAGISSKRTAQLRMMAKSGQVRLQQTQSSSANPGQVSGFMEPSNWDNPDELALEFELHRVTSLSAFHIHRSEMEILVEPGDYRVLAHFKNVPYSWQADTHRGLTSKDTYLLTPM